MTSIAGQGSSSLRACLELLRSCFCAAPLVLLFGVDVVSAAPSRTQRDLVKRLVKRQDSSSSSTPTPSSTSSSSSSSSTSLSQIIIPVIVIVSLTFFLVVIKCVRSFRQRRAAAAAPVNASSNTTANTNNAQRTASANAAGEGRPPRRSRPRRTPSQISTISLPAYMKEPGEQELVIFRGPLDEEVHPSDGGSADESSDEASPHSGQYTPIPHHDDEHGHLESSDRRPETAMSNVQSLFSTESGASLLPTHGEADPRGAAPSYFEVFGTEGEERTPGPTNLLDGNRITTGEESSAGGDVEAGSGSRPRNSRFLNFLGTFKPNQGNTGPSRHSRGNSRQSNGPSEVHELQRTHSPASSFSALRSLNPSHLRLNNNMSASSISLNSISAPLTQTAMRTAVQAPKGGLTADQIKLFSSKDGFGRFGVPYGPDAVAFSASRLTLEHPPPAFENDDENEAGPSDAQSDESPPQPTGESAEGNEEIPAEEREITVSPATPPASASMSSSQPSNLKPSSPAPTAEQPQGPSPSSSPVPPSLSSYKPPSINIPESRTSSALSFATAAETVTTSRPGSPAESHPETPTTARPTN